MTKYLRYRDLVAMGVVNNRMTLSRWIKDRGFPAPIELGPNTVAFDAAAVAAWEKSRPVRRPTSAEAA